jgi:FKBP-type peptidyl-prolyl cis-trans isomerase 2
MLDLNHPMSGQKDIEAEIEIMEVRSPSDSELSYFLKRKAPLVTIV